MANKTGWNASTLWLTYSANFNLFLSLLSSQRSGPILEKHDDNFFIVCSTSTKKPIVACLTVFCYVLKYCVFVLLQLPTLANFLSLDYSKGPIWDKTTAYPHGKGNFNVASEAMVF